MKRFIRLRREIHTIATFVGLRRALGSVRADGTETVADAIEARVDMCPDATAIVWRGNPSSYRHIDEEANRVANWALGEGIERGSVVALMMENCPVYITVWYGLAKIGVQTALINTNLSGQPLRHALKTSQASDLVACAELAEALADVRGHSGMPSRLWSVGEPIEGCQALESALAQASPKRPDHSVRTGVRSGDNLFFIYTSGTTGYPKAACFSHLRFIQVGRSYRVLAGITPADRCYCVLPLYHTAGGVMSVSMSLLNGATLVLAKRFSASRFWRDCRDNGVTVFQYIGELCRYLLNLPESPDDRRHSVRCAIGNGLRPDIWPRFVSRFGIADVREFYGATEGNFALVNIDNKVGAVGRIPAYARGYIPVKLVRYDIEADAHIRDSRGFCIEAGVGEPGEALGRISHNDRDPIGRFEGYRDAEATKEKVLRDVFRHGDAWYRTGDLLKRDSEGYFYFVDRIGDTFRWKGENVATSEVADVLSVYPGVQEANVYGVAVAGSDGRAGMAAVVAGGDLDLDGLLAYATRELAAYARPLFLRVRTHMETTSTFKHRKRDLVREGFDPSKVEDALYFRDDEEGRFVPLDDALYRRIVEGRARL